MNPMPELLLSCWIVEAARSSVLAGRGHSNASVRSAERARLIASACADNAVRIVPSMASQHAKWMAEVAGSEQETGALGWFFLQRLGTYVQAHLKDQMSPGPHRRLVGLAAQDADEVNAALAMGDLPKAPVAAWPQNSGAKAPGVTKARFAILGDPHVAAEDSNPLVHAAISDLNQQDIVFTIALGDLTRNGVQEAFAEASRIFSKAARPMLLTLGNHDMGGGGGAAGLGPQRFEAVFSQPPSSVHEIPGARVVIINSADPRPSPFPPFDLLGGEFRTDPYESIPGGRISEETIEWMKTVKPGEPTFILLHHPPFPYLGFPPLLFGLDEQSTSALLDLAVRTSARAIFCGHTHRSALTYLHGVPVIEVPSVKEWPYGYGIVEVTDQGWSFSLTPISVQPEPKDNDHAGYIFRRYALGPDEARAFIGS